MGEGRQPVSKKRTLLTSEGSVQRRGRRRGRKRTFVHGVVVLRCPEFLLVNSSSTPPAIRTEHNVLSGFHVSPPVTNVRPCCAVVKSRFLMKTIGKSYRE